LLDLDQDGNLDFGYPDLTAGVAGYLKTNSEIDPQVRIVFNRACQEIMEECQPWINNAIKDISDKWGIPWANNPRQKYHPRLLNPSWLVEDIEPDTKNDSLNAKRTYIEQGTKIIQRYYPGNNPTSWYVLACGDGDNMGEWLKGTKLKAYESYIPTALNPDPEIEESFKDFIELPKRMGPSTHSALSRALLDFSNQLVPYITESRYAGRLIYSGGDDVLAYTNLWEWDDWLWDIRQCFRGEEDPREEFISEGDYWQSDRFKVKRPLFTMGSLATISFGVIIAHHSVPLAIALENLWQAQEEAKEYVSLNNDPKDAVQVRVIYGNGNILKATTKFTIFHKWQFLLNLDLESSIFEQASNLLEQHPIPCREAISPWTNAFCSRREQLKEKEIVENIQDVLGSFFDELWLTTQEDKFITTAKDWLKLAAFVKRNREIKLNMEEI
jgi:CRISPR-associated protein Cmr2